MPRPPALDLLSQVVSAELEVLERRGEALDSKAGVVLGFAGVLVGLTASQIRGAVGQAGFAAAAMSAVLAMAAFMPRPFATLDPLRLRMRYLAEPEELTKQRLLDTRILVYRFTDSSLQRKARLVTGAVIMLAFSVVLSGLGATL